MRYAVTGIGIIDGLGYDLDSNFDKILNESSNFKLHPNNFTGKYDPVMNLGMLTAETAIAQSGLSTSIYQPAPVLTSSINAGKHSLLDFVDKFYNNAKRVSPTRLLSSGSSFLSSTIAEKYNLTGPNFNVSAACTGSMNVIELGCMFIDKGAPFAVVSGYDCMSDNFSDGYDSWSFDMMMASSPTGQLLAFDEQANGSVIGDGACTMIIENYQHAIDRGANILAVIDYVSSSSDSDHPVRPSMSGVGLSQLLDNLPDFQIDYINAHGTGTPLGDPLELNILSKYFTDIPISSFKNNVGHTMGAASIIETAYCVKVLQTGIIPKSCNVTKPIDKNVVMENITKPINTILKVALGFGGRCATAVLSRYND